MQKAILHILAGREKKITETETVRQPLPHKDFRFANPFIVLHHGGPTAIPAGSHMRINPHPHRGFAPYTFMLRGEGYHRDNTGNDKTVGEGGVQWMFAGAGILHSEGPTEQLLAHGGIQEFIQLWINVSKDRKLDRPFYQSATKEQLPRILRQDGVNIRLASGDYDGQTGPILNFTPVISAVGEIAAGKQVRFTATPGWWALLYIINGSVAINNSTPVNAFNLVVFENSHDEFLVKATEDTQVLFLSAEPIDEPVAAKDNFVMNTPEEITQAMEDYKNGKFGKLEW